ncbi:MAG: D-alanyl-D-alanine carboxypeptidase family protein [Verrucomicrobiaceae bacterium]
MPVARIFAAFSLILFHAACSSAAPPAPVIATPVRVQPSIVRPALPDPAAPSVYAASAIVVDAVTGRILFEKNARTERAVASTQKLLTALCVVRAGPLTDEVVIEHSDTLVEPTKLYLKPGERYTRGELLKALIVKSGNDVAMALGRDVAGSKEQFADLMNRTARSIGMSQTHFVNPHGLTEPNQFSTARDMAILAREVQKYSAIRESMRIRSYVFTYPDGRTRTLSNTNKILSRLSYCDGMKTGTTNAAGRCLVSSGRLNGRAVIAVVLGSNSANVWDDSEKLLRWSLE